MAAQTGSTYISRSMADGIEIPTANLQFLTTASSMKVCPDIPDIYDKDRHPQKWKYSGFDANLAIF